MKNPLFLLLFFFLIFTQCFASFPLKNTNIHIQNQDIYISDQIVEDSDPVNFALPIVVLSLAGLIGWLFYRSSKTQDLSAQKRLDNTATILGSGLIIFLILLAIGAIVASVLFFQWLNQLTSELD